MWLKWLTAKWRNDSCTVSLSLILIDFKSHNRFSSSSEEFSLRALAATLRTCVETKLMLDRCGILSVGTGPDNTQPKVVSFATGPCSFSPFLVFPWSHPINRSISISQVPKVMNLILYFSGYLLVISRESLQFIITIKDLVTWTVMVVVRRELVL